MRLEWGIQRHTDSEKTCRIEIMYDNAEGKTYEEDFDGKGRSREEAKENSALKALQRSCTLQSAKHGAYAICSIIALIAKVGNLQAESLQK